MAQFGRPNASTAGGWTPVGDSTCHECTDEVTPNSDTDYVEADYLSDTCILDFSDLTDPDVATGHVLRFTGKQVGTKLSKLDVYVYQTTTLIATAYNNLNMADGTYTLYQYTLTEAQANTITDYTALRVYFVVDTLDSAETLRITQAEFEVPDVASGGLFMAQRNLNGLGVGGPFFENPLG